MTSGQQSQTSWFDIECQLDEIILQMHSGVPEEHIMRSIGITYEDWSSYKAQRLTPVLSLLRTSTFGSFLDPMKQKPNVHTFKTTQGHMRLAP